MVHKPTVIDPAISYKNEEFYEDIQGVYWKYDSHALKAILVFTTYAKKVQPFPPKLRGWIERRISYLEMKELLESRK